MTSNYHNQTFWEIRAHQWLRILEEASTLQEILDRLVLVLPWRIVAFYRIYESENLVVAEASKGYERLNWDRVEFPLLPENNIVSYCYMARTTIRLMNDDDLAKLNLGSQSRFMIKSLNVEESAAVPLIHGGKVVGVIYVADNKRTSEDSLTDEAIRSLELISPTVAFAIARQELLEKTEQENRVLYWIQEMSKMLLFLEDEEQLWDKFRQMLFSLGNVHGGIYIRFHDGVPQMKDIFGDLSRFSAKLTPEWLVQTMRNRNSLVCDNSSMWSSKDLLVPEYISSQLESEHEFHYGIQVNEKCLGTVYIYLQKVEDHVARVLPSLFQMFSFALELVLQRTELKRLSRCDPLTGLWNRRALQDYTTQSLSNILGEESFIIIDVDGFKELNDTLGHDIGDQALIEFGRWLQQEYQQGFVSRIGGDEFALFLKGAHDGIEQDLLKSPLAKYNLSASYGLVYIAREAKDFKTAYKIADERMYSRKKLRKITR